MALPTLQVRIGNPLQFDITSKVLAVDGYQISRGRDDWQSAVTAGEMTLTLNNSDGRFTPGSTIITSPSPIVVDQKINIREIVNGVTYSRFTGYVKSWPVEWPGIVASVAKVRLTATDLQPRAERRTLRSPVQEEILGTAPPAAYYMLSEPAGATTAGDASGFQKPPLSVVGTGAAMAFGATSPVPDGLTCATFAGGKYLQGSRAVYVPAGSAYTLECYFATTQVPTVNAPIVGVGDGTSLVPNTYLGLTASGKLQGSVNGVTGAANISSAASVNDGLVHHAALTLTAGGALTLYLDGASVATAAGVGTYAADLTLFTVAPDVGFSSNYVGTVAHAATKVVDLPPLIIAQHALGRLAFAGESGASRITRLAGYADLPALALDSSLTNVTALNPGPSIWSAMQDAADAELGTVYIRDDVVTFHNRNKVVSKTAPDLTLTSQWITPEVTPVHDDQLLVNYMEVTAEGTGATALATNSTSEASHGRYPGSRSYAVLTDAEALDRANWLVAKLAEPTTRYGTLTINLYGMTPAMASSVLAAIDLNCWLRVTSMASQNPGGATADVIVQGFTETVSADTWTIACNVVSQSLYSPVWILGTSQLGVDTVLYV